MLCNKNWEAEGVIGFTTIEEAKLKAENGYKGISNKWHESEYSEEEISEFLRNEYEVDPKSEWWRVICSFCGKKDSELEAVLKGKYASICKSCVSKYYEAFKSV